MLFVDVEGAEGLVLNGARRIIERDKPLIYFESYEVLLKKFGSNSKSIAEYLINLGYEIRDGLKPDLHIHYPHNGEIIAFHYSCPLIMRKTAICI
jgi:hypothetical protein